jgi:hypothetical protein
MFERYMKLRPTKAIDVCRGMKLMCLRTMSISNKR